MATDVSLDVLAQSSVTPAQKVPVGIGLAVGALASITLWAFVGIGLRVLLA